MSDIYMPSHDLEIESQVIGALLLNPKLAFNACTDYLLPDDFYLDLHKSAFSVAMDLIRENGTCDPVALVRGLSRAAKSTPEVEIRAFAMEVMERTASAANVAYHAKAVREMAIRRRIAAICNASNDMCQVEDYTNDEILDQLHTELEQIGSRSTVKIAPKLAVDHLDDVIREMTHVPGKGLATGLYTLDYMTGGIKPGDYVVIAARPSVGKTTMGLNLGVNMAGNGCRVVFVSLETSGPEILKTILSMKGGPYRWKYNPFWRSKLTSEDVARTKAAAANIKTLDLTIADDKRFWGSPERLCAEIRAMHAKRPVDVVIVDHFHLLRQRAAGRQRADQIMAEASQMFQNLAKDIKTVVIVLAQFNREIEKENRQPRMSDIRECGKIEEDADIVCMLGYDHARKEGFDYKQGHRNPFRVCTVAKAKLASGGYFHLQLNPNSMTFTDLDELTFKAQQGGGDGDI